MALDVKVKIDLVKPLGKAGFGIPLILEENATTEKSYTECRNLDDIIAAGFAATTKVYKAANTMLMQDNYKRYLENSIRNAVDFTGTPIRINLKSRDEKDMF